MSPLKISMVSYINSKPFQLGMELTGLIDQIELHLEIPAITAQKLKHNEVDIALVPVATLPHLPQVNIITDYCIGATHFVDSVLLLSQVPIHQIKKIYLDSHSRTSANLIQILCREYWEQEVEFMADVSVNVSQIKGDTACLMIGDKALEAKGDFAYEYDLARVWHQHTGLPFVFAVWVANNQGKPLESELNEAFAEGLKDLNQVASFYQSVYPKQDMKRYFFESINYQFDKEKAKALDLFLTKMKKNQIILA